ncbi:CPBP family intramembrane metalloprotease [Streptosporangiaceae bacterium NEAU-GS5]|nr:CPBP family intramembrane metalloprotease [Streptosporangiaceae bacterium NEAU-GS5]
MSFAGGHRVGRRARKISVVAGTLAGLCGIFLSGGRPLVAALGALAVVLATNRSTLQWMYALPAADITRRAFRVAVYLLPWAVVGPPRLTAGPAALAAGVVIAIPPLAAEWRSIGFSLRRDVLRGMPIDAVRRTQDLITFSLGGAAQEYLYRWVLLVPLLAWNAVAAVGASAVLFAVEHHLHLNGSRTWDRQDVAVHLYLGVALGAAVWLTGSLTVALVAHTLYNLPNVLHTALRPAPVRAGALEEATTR